MSKQTRPIDPITFEVLRHRLWAINDEAGATIRRISGSPVATEAYDFNTGLLTADGEMLLVGVYISAHASVQDLIVQHILQEYGDNPGIGEDDMFLTGDPYVGALHQPDITCVAPVHWEGKLVAWCGCTVHQVDVGGPAPGSVTVGARSIYEEAPPIPPIKIVQGGTLRRDIEREYLRRSRTPELVGLDLRAQIAANNVAKARIRDLITRNGLETALGAMAQMIDYVEERFRERLRGLPDGVWRHVTFIEHDGIEDKVYPVRLEMTKASDRITFDFRESAEQAPALINCCLGGLRGNIMANLLPFLCYDMPWTPAGLWRAVTLLSRPGTVVDAAWPAGVSIAPMGAGWAARACINACIGKMMAASPQYRDHAMAVWMGSYLAQNLGGTNQRQEPFATVIVDSMAGGTGARTYKDGIDSGGFLSSLACVIANVETNEHFFPMLYLYRRQTPDSGGPGRFRGGVGGERAFVPYDTPRPLDSTLFSFGGEAPASAGISGGYPGGTCYMAIKRNSNLWEVFRRGKVAASLEDLEGDLDALPAMARTRLGPNDVTLCAFPGGGGFGDPIDRDPQLVLADVLNGLVSREWAERIYGVVLSGEGTSISTSLEATNKRREELCRIRSPGTNPRQTPRGGGHPFDEPLFLDQGNVFCRRCGYSLGPASQNFKLRARLTERPLTAAGPAINRHGPSPRFVLREFACPGCGTMLEVEVNLKESPILGDRWTIE
ncbi:MAG: hydantoinase B/oxoprolinase family protein [Dehalococcoidia bacterium]|nr:hydantoinase B/oxoprolinase family protein [Dehalococcoidia bacterium]